MRTWPPRAALGAAAAVLAASGALTACGPAAQAPAPSASHPAVLTVWVHSGTSQERASTRRQLDAWEAAHPEVRVALRVVTEGDYTDVLQSASAAGDLPDLVEVDGPLLANLDYQGALADLHDVLPRATLDRLIPSLVQQGTVRGRFVGAGEFDSGLGLFASRQALARVGARLPTGPDDAWTAAETTSVLARLARHDRDGEVLDLKRSYGVGEWLTYGFAPAVWSAGGDLVDRTTGRASGVLDGPASVSALRTLQRWQRYVDPDPHDDAFVSGRVALSWVGHWAYPDYRAALGDDLVVLPLPDFGHGSRTSLGSWTWSVAQDSPHRREAGELLDTLLQDGAVARTAAANGAVPATRAALEGSQLYGTDGPLRLFADQLARPCGDHPQQAGCVAVPRPLTPAYPAITAQFAQAVDAVFRGADVRTALHRAALAVDADLAANRGWR
ncbi:extracellular solute-binding protein [Angustibacter peucedani]